MDITYFWNSTDETIWMEKLGHYQDLILPEILPLDKKMNSLDRDEIKAMTSEEFYRFLYDEYLLWKFPPNRLATTRKAMRQYMLLHELDELGAVQRQLFSFDLNDAEQGILIARKIYGLGTAGASGLLSLLFPEFFGSVDQFAVKAFSMIEGFPARVKYRIDGINPAGIKPNEGALLINIMREKAKELNAANNTAFWTPRKIDMVLWAAR